MRRLDSTGPRFGRRKGLIYYSSCFEVVQVFGVSNARPNKQRVFALPILAAMAEAGVEHAQNSEPCVSLQQHAHTRRRQSRLNNAESKDELNVAARRIARRRSSMRAIPIGILLHQVNQMSSKTKVRKHQKRNDKTRVSVHDTCPRRLVCESSLTVTWSGKPQKP